MAPVNKTVYEKLETGMPDLENVSLDEQQEDIRPPLLSWQRRTSLTKFDLAIRFVLGFFFILTILNIGFLLGDRLVGTTCDSTLSDVSDSEDTLWRGSLRSLTDSEPRRFDATLYSRNKYRGPPSAELDAEWDRFTTNPWMVETAAVLNVSREEALRSGNAAELETVVNLDKDNGGGYMATLEVFHQLHCLNVLRKWTYWDHYVEIDPFFQTRADHRREHAEHCIDVLRQALMCNSDLGLILFHWVKDIQIPAPDFNTLHQCRDPEAVLAWAKENEAPIQHSIVKTTSIIEADHPF